MVFSKIKFKIGYLLIIFAFFFVFGTKLVYAEVQGTSNKVMDLGEVDGIDTFASTDEYTFFNIYNGSFYELWRTDGTESGTILLKSFNSGNEESISGDLYATNDRVFFKASTPATGEELWVSDGTVIGTHMTKDINGISQGSLWGNLITTDEYIFFTAIDDPISNTGVELWVSDGTESGTHIVEDITPGPEHTYLNLIGAKDDNAYFGFNNSSDDSELWVSDGTEVGTTRIATIGYIEEETGIFYNDEFYFKAADDEHGIEVWKTDGTEAGTSMLYDIYEGSSGSFSAHFAVSNDRLYFVAYNGDGIYIWETDGTESGTSILDGPYLKGLQDFEQLVSLNNVLYFIANLEDEDNKVWRTDGTEEGTYIVKDIPNIRQLDVFNDKLYFTANTGYDALDGEYTSELYESDGTESGTRMLAYHLSQGEGPYPFFVGKDGIYYNQATTLVDYGWAKSWNGDVELWSYKPVMPVSNYTVTFKDYNETVLKTETVEEGSPATAPSIPARTGYTFTGWDKAFNNVTGNLTVTAQYSINTYTVLFKNYNDAILKTQIVQYGNGATAPSNPNRTGYIFTGWSKNYSNIVNNLTVTALYRVYVSDNQTNDPGVETPEPKLVIDKITPNLAETDEEEINGNIKILGDNKELIDVYDVNLILDGQKIQPDGYIEIRILMTAEQKEYENLQVIYINYNNEVEVIPHRVDGDYIVFSVNHLSKYAVIGEKQEVNNPIDVRDDKETNEKGNNNTILIIGGISLFLIILLIIVFRGKNKKEQ